MSFLWMYYLSAFEVKVLGREIVFLFDEEVGDACGEVLEVIEGDQACRLILLDVVERARGEDAVVELYAR